MAPVYVTVAVVVRYVVVLVKRLFLTVAIELGLETFHYWLATTLLFLIVVIEIQARLHQLVHFVLVCTLVIQIAPIVIFSMEHVNWRITVVLVVVKHALEPAFLLLLELVLATQVASSDFDPRLQVL